MKKKKKKKKKKKFDSEDTVYLIRDSKNNFSLTARNTDTEDELIELSLI
jgi:hypothetical protein